MYSNEIILNYLKNGEIIVSELDDYSLIIKENYERFVKDELNRLQDENSEDTKDK